MVLDNLDPFYDVGIKEWNVQRCREDGGEAYTFVEGSITYEVVIEDLSSAHDIEFVYHEAARAGVRPSVE